MSPRKAENNNQVGCCPFYYWPSSCILPLFLHPLLFFSLSLSSSHTQMCISRERTHIHTSSWALFHVKLSNLRSHLIPANLRALIVIVASLQIISQPLASISRCSGTIFTSAFAWPLACVGACASACFVFTWSPCPCS